MRWFWRKKPKLLDIPPHRIELDFKPLEPKDPGIVVTEEEMSATGLFRIFGKRPKEPE